MTMINNASESLEVDAAKSVKRSRLGKSKPKGARNAAKAKSARQKASQSGRQPSGSKRSFNLTSEALKELRAEGDKRFINPYRDGSNYHACVAALRKLGTGRFHSFDKIIPTIVAELGEAARAFVRKKNRSDVTGKNWKERAVQNVKVLARSDYGAKLRQIGYEVRIDKNKGAGLFNLGGK